MTRAHRTGLLHEATAWRNSLAPISASGHRREAIKTKEEIPGSERSM